MRAAAAADMGAALAAAIVASHDYKQRGLRQATGIMAATQAASMCPIVAAVAARGDRSRDGAPPNFKLPYKNTIQSLKKNRNHRLSR